MADGSHVRVSINMDELVASYAFETQRRLIDSEGAKGIWNGFGQAVIEVNGESVLALHIHEDAAVGVVLDVLPVRQGHTSTASAYRVELESRGIVPPRTGRKN